MTSAHALTRLAPLRWRGLTAPCSDASFDFSHEQAERAYPYVDGAGHDWTGRGPIQTAATLLFHNTIEPDLYPTRWLEWRAELFDGAIGELSHPDLGSIRARVLRGSVTISAKAISGVTAQVSWTESIESPDEQTVFGIAYSPTDAAKNAESAMKDFNIKAKVDGKETSSPFSDFLSKLNLLPNGDARIARLINQAIGVVRQVRDAVNGGDDHKRWPLLEHLDVLEDGFREREKQARRAARPTASQKVPGETTLEVFALEHGNALIDVMGLNPHALRRPTVAAGTILHYYTDS